MTFHPERSATAGSKAAGADEPRQARQVALPSAPRAAGLARQEIREALTSWGLDRLEDTAVLLATELVGNAVRHAHHDGSELELRIADTGAWLRIEVSDADPHPPQPHLPAELDESGFGFVLVEALAAKWGVDQATAGKTVWIELDTGRAGHSGSPPPPNQANAARGGLQQREPRPSGQPTSEATAAASDHGHQAAGTSAIPAAEIASVCRCAAALIQELGWDPLAETCNAAGPLPMDVAIFSVTEARGYDRPDDILDAVLTHIAGLLYAAGEVTRQTLVHDMTDVAMTWEARPGRTAQEVLTVLNLTASILDNQAAAATTRGLGPTSDHSQELGQKAGSGFASRQHRAA
jgi:anti-sigma regulatory factor (Ser/Thr protein kinase)